MLLFLKQHIGWFNVQIRWLVTTFFPSPRILIFDLNIAINDRLLKIIRWHQRLLFCCRVFELYCRLDESFVNVFVNLPYLRIYSSFKLFKLFFIILSQFRNLIVLNASIDYWLNIRFQSYIVLKVLWTLINIHIIFVFYTLQNFEHLFFLFYLVINHDDWDAVLLQLAFGWLIGTVELIQLISHDSDSRGLILILQINVFNLCASYSTFQMIVIKFRYLRANLRMHLNVHRAILNLQTPHSCLRIKVIHIVFWVLIDAILILRCLHCKCVH